MKNSIDLESTPAILAWHTASNTLGGLCEILADSPMVKDPDGDHRLEEVVGLVKRLVNECDSAAIKIMEEYEGVRIELQALKQATAV